ncbi:MAG: hypothetical protein RIS45_1078 [Planctomycetota bacterium]|jgi:hypothetical protein
MSVLTEYLQLPSGFWIRKSDNSGPYFVDVETDEATAIGTSESGGTVTNTLGPLTLNDVILGNDSRDVKRVAGISTDGVSQLNLGVAGASVGKVSLRNATSGSITLQPATGALGTVTLEAQAVSGVIALMSDVAAAVASVSWKAAVRVATTVAGTLASSFENGDTVDGVVLATGDRILIKNQAAGAENGIYTVNASGTPTRATDADSGAELVAASCLVLFGTANANTQWVCTTPSPITPGSTSLTFVQFNVGGGGGGDSTYLGAAADETAMLALSSAIVGDYCTRTDLGTPAFLLALPPATLANWVIIEPAASASEPSWRGIYTTVASLPSSGLIVGDTATMNLTGLNPFTVVATSSTTWKAAQQVFKRVCHRVAGTTSASAQMAAGWKWQMPAGLATLFSEAKADIFYQKSAAATDTLTGYLTLGSAGSTADTQVTPNPSPMISAANGMRSMHYDIIFLSNTTLRTIGTDVGSGTATNTTQVDANVPLITLGGSDDFTDALYWGVSVTMNGTTITPTVSLAITLIP